MKLSGKRQMGMMQRALWSVLLLILMAFAWRAEAATELSVREAHAVLMQKGRSVLKDGEPAKSIVYFSKAWRLAPTDPSAQLAMAEAWAQAGQVRRAEAFLRHLLREPSQQKNADLYLAALGKLARRYPFQFSASFAFLPSTNIKNTSSETYFDTLWGRFTIDDGGAETSGVGVEMGAQLLYRRPLAEGLTFELGTTLRRVWYEAPELRYWRGRLSADLKAETQQSSLRAGVHVDRTYYSEVEEDSSDRIATGLHGAWFKRLSDIKTLSVSGVFEYRNYLDKGTLSGNYASLGLGWSKQVTPSGVVSLGGTLERSTPSLEYHRYWGAGLKAGYLFDLSETLRAGVDVGATLRLYDTDFPSVEYARRDEIYRIGLTLSDSRIKIMGGTPKLSCGYKIQNSNVALYSSETTDCRIGWSYSF
ncbi:surface lipoprotein assembly modifier [Celeribacter sp. ULVN23_4]